MTMRRIGLTGLLTALLAGCQTPTPPYTLVESGVHRASAYSFATPINWSQRSSSAPVVWTVDGEGLEFMLHFDGIESGTKIFKGMPEDGQPFSADMRASDIADLFIESFGQARGAGAVRLLSLRPTEFGPWSGFAFELEFESVGGLPMRALATGAVVDERLYLIVYAGARDYYFDKYLPHVEEIVNSIAPAD